MTKTEEAKALLELETKIGEWFEETEVDLPYIGEDTILYMGKAALQVLFIVSDIHKWIVDNGRPLIEK